MGVDNGRYSSDCGGRRNACGFQKKELFSLKKEHSDLYGIGRRFPPILRFGVFPHTSPESGEKHLNVNWEMEEKDVKQKLLAILTVLVFLAGLSLLAYPVVSNLLYEKEQEEIMKHYNSIISEEMTSDDQTAELQECQDYNRGLLQGGVLLTDPFDKNQLDPSAMPYAGLLNIDDEGGMAYLRIPAIDVELMIYHGTGQEVLKKGVGHLQGSSLPVGGTGTHCVLSAHTGLNNKKLFTDLDQLENGDVFYIHVLGEVLAYQVDQIRVVLPEETEDLQINAQEDYVTLVTCTPYGINTHRLLVRGTRIPYVEETEQTGAVPVRQGSWMEQYLKAAAAGMILVAVVAVGSILRRRTGAKKPGRRRRKR